MSNQVLNVPVMWDIHQATEKTGLSRFTIKQLIKNEQIKFIRTGVGKRGKFLINAQSLCNFMKGGEQA